MRVAEFVFRPYLVLSPLTEVGHECLAADERDSFLSTERVLIGALFVFL